MLKGLVAHGTWLRKLVIAFSSDPGNIDGRAFGNAPIKPQHGS
jgi:hypothetical protein